MTMRMKERILFALLLAAMLMLTIVPAAFAEEGAASVQMNIVEAATVDELLKAIAPNTLITLTGRSYDLTRAQGYGIYGSQYYSWNPVYDDGWELEIDDVQNLTIRAAQEGTEIVTVPRYACVLKFDNCADVTLSGFTAGHTDGPGYCTGAVLGMTDCRDMTVENCDLYGCGTYGLELSHCRGINAIGTVIRDCSYGALSADNCAAIKLDSCDVRWIDGISGLFMLSGCRECALLNSTVHDCTAESLVQLRTTKGFIITGCEISHNRFQGMFFSDHYEIVVTGTAFPDNRLRGGWYLDDWQTSAKAVSQTTGEPYTDEELAAMPRERATGWSAAEEPDYPTAAPEVSEDGMIHVHSVDELLASIAPNTAIYLEDGVYNLSEASGYGYAGGDFWYWMDCFDGPGLVIRGVDNLIITAAGPHRARIVAEPRYCDVLSFENCSGVTLSNFTAGHTQSIENFGCAGGVLSFMDCRDFKVDNCSLYGCGIMGVTCYNCRGGEISYTEIHDCTDGACYFYNSRDIALTTCNIHDIPNYTYQIYDCRNITADGKEIPEGSSW
ncbi:MAG: right-handed parallel beta-helix repeat-containing protein [Oscillospiraceae bacterium]|nr:right-handed parallel beta-helix repeat-containing protein [Oscillospiraceae bacterium]